MAMNMYLLLYQQVTKRRPGKQPGSEESSTRPQAPAGRSDASRAKAAAERRVRPQVHEVAGGRAGALSSCDSRARSEGALSRGMRGAPRH